MIRHLALVALLCVATWPALGELDPYKRYTIIGNYLPIEEDPDYATLANPLHDKEDQGDLSKATVMVLEEIADEQGEVQTVELARACMSNGRWILEGEIDEPVFARISVKTVDGETLSVRTLLEPRQVTTFAVLDHQGSFPPDQLVLVGASRLAKNQTKRYTIVGDLTGVDEEHYPMPTVVVRGTRFDEEGSRGTFVFGKVQAREGIFLIDGEIDEPQIVNISVLSNMGQVWGWSEAIIEPKSVISVVVSAPWVNRLAATAGTGKHAELIGKWRMSEEYLATEAALDDEFKKLRSGTETSKREQGEETGEELDEEIAAEPIVEIHSSPVAAIGCEHIEIRPDATNHVRSEIALTGTNPAYITLQDKLRQIRNSALQELAFNSSDPLDSLLALELNPFTSPQHEVIGAALPIYEKLMTLLDEDTVAHRVKPPMDQLARLVARDTNDRSLIPGQKAPEFDLPALGGTEVSLTDVLSDNEYVFIDFWASWCAPCIEDFPELKDLHTTYRDNGFEVLTISIDNTHQDWKEAAEKIKFAWIDVGSIGGMETNTPIAYGVSGIPKGYLVDAKGCIVQKDIRPEQLAEFLSARYGQVPSGN